MFTQKLERSPNLLKKKTTEILIFDFNMFSPIKSLELLIGAKRPKRDLRLHLHRSPQSGFPVHPVLHPSLKYAAGRELVSYGQLLNCTGKW